MTGRVLASALILVSAACAEGGAIDGEGGGDSVSASSGPGSPGSGAGEPSSSNTSSSGSGCGVETCNAKDDDCNGTIDDPDQLNGLACETGTPGACGSGTTLCQAGVTTCVPNTAPGTQPELCNAIDDDCNNQVDDLDANDVCPTQVPNAQNVATWSCTGECAITACTSGASNFNGSVDDGCECITDSASPNCDASATTTVPIGGTVALSGVVEVTGQSDWLTFQFDMPAANAGYHPRVELTNNAGGSYSMDVLVDCQGTAAGCSTTGGANDETGIAATVWEQNYVYTPGPGCCSDPTPRQSIVRVRINRSTPAACDSYTVTATNP